MILRMKDSLNYVIDPKNIFVLEGYQIKFYNLVKEPSPKYLSPEQRHTKSKKITQMSQVYALGMIMSEMVTALDQRGQTPTGVPNFLERITLSMIQQNFIYRPNFRKILDEKLITHLRKMTVEEAFIW